MAPYAAVAIAAVGTGVAIYSAVKQGEAAKAAGEENAKAAEDNAKQAKKQYLQEESAFRLQSRKQLGDMRASYAASGVELEGSPMDVLQESAERMEVDALKIREQGNYAETAYLRDAEISRSRGDRGQESGYLSAAGALAGGAGKYLSYKGNF